MKIGIIGSELIWPATSINLPLRNGLIRGTDYPWGE